MIQRIFILAIFIHAHARAADNLRDLANSKLTLSAKSAEITTPSLVLQDDFVPPARRSYSFLTKLTLEPYQTQGQIELSGVGTYYLSDLSSTLLPSLYFGFVRSSLEDFMWGTYVRAAWSRQSMQFQSPNANSAYLSTTQVSLGAEARIQTKHPKWWTRLALEYGNADLTQSAELSQYRWSQNLNFASAQIGFMYEHDDHWLSELSYNIYRPIQELPEWQFARENLSAGLAYQW